MLVAGTEGLLADKNLILRMKLPHLIFTTTRSLVMLLSFFLFDGVSLHYLGCLGTLHVDQPSHKLTETCLPLPPAPRRAELKGVCAIKPGCVFNFFLKRII